MGLGLRAFEFQSPVVADEPVRRASQPAVVGRHEAAIADRGGARLVLETSGRPDYARARRFYRKGGFAEVGRIPDFYDRNDDCIIYSKTLSGGVSA